jgi:hypothetical protein
MENMQNVTAALKNDGKDAAAPGVRPRAARGLA